MYAYKRNIHYNMEFGKVKEINRGFGMKNSAAETAAPPG